MPLSFHHLARSAGPGAPTAQKPVAEATNSAMPIVARRKLCHALRGLNAKRILLLGISSPPRRSHSLQKTREALGAVNTVGPKEGIEPTYDWFRRNVFETHGVRAK